MGDFTKRLTERRMHTEIVQGHCLICGSYGRLSWDHVPPQGSITISKVEQVHLTEVMGVNAVPIKGVKSPNGSKFKTICKACNSNHLGANDQEVARVYKGITQLVTHYFTYANSPLSYVTIPFNSVRFCRAMIGHVLSATSVNECIRTPVETPYFTPLQNFVMGDDAAIENTHDLYCWFFPHRHHLSAKMFACWNKGNLCTVSVLSFFPLAFSITEKGKGIFPSGATKVELTDDRLFVNLSSEHLPYSGFPLVGLSGDQMMAMASSQAIISYPINS
ncbi:MULTISPECIES: metal-binding protein [unclassified Pseudomonas]|uniref:metal-binding protein n=1 Tax=unclassified Pseudomonas TaxID=196821 RepID=UPI0009F230DB|nr:MULTISPECIES: metal-binding protein [unclassified Pseudomonas]